MNRRVKKKCCGAIGLVERSLLILMSFFACGQASAQYWGAPPTTQMSSYIHYPMDVAKRACVDDLAYAFRIGAQYESQITTQGIIKRDWKVHKNCVSTTWTSEQGVTYPAFEMRVENYIKYDPREMGWPASPEGDMWWYGSMAMIYPYNPNSINRGKSVTNQCEPSCLGNPVRFSEGNKTETVVDFTSQHDARLRWVRYYNSSVMMDGGRLGVKWRHSFSRSISSPSSSGETALAQRDDGQIVVFKRESDVWSTDADITLRLTQRSDVPGWVVGDHLNRLVELYDQDGDLEVIDYEDGYFVRLHYSTSPVKRLVGLTDRSGRSISVDYDSAGYMSEVTMPDGRKVTYTYEGYEGNPLVPYRVLSSVTNHDGTSRRYKYVPEKIGLLRAIVDEEAVEYVHFTYDDLDRAVGTTRSGGAGAYLGVIANHVTPAPLTATIVDPNGLSLQYEFQLINGVNRTSKITRNCTGQCAAAATYTYDSNGRIDLHVDFSGVVTDRDYDDQGRLTRQIDAVGTSSQRRVETDWHPAFNAPVQRRIYDASGYVVARYDWTYNVRGQVLTEVVADPATGSSRTVSTFYCEQTDVDVGVCPWVGLVRQVDGPRIDIADVMTYTYRMNDEASCATASASCPYRKGDVWKVTNSLGQSTETLFYDGAGRPLSVRDANGVRTDIEYTLRGAIAARKTRGADDGSEADDRITRMTYWPTGQIRRVTQPDGSWTEYGYDEAHRPTSVTDNSGNTITYTLNAAGERLGEQTRDHTGSLRRSLARAYNTLGQLRSQTDGYQRITTFTYDNKGNIDQTTDALERVTDNDYDALGRLMRTLQNAMGGQGDAVETTFEYDALDNLTKVIDPNQLSTTFVYNGLGELKRLQSPDTGVTTYAYDAAGNRQSQTDARGVQTQYGYDALNRITLVTYPSDSSLNTSYVYDVAQPDCASGETFLIGRLAMMTDHSGSTVYCHDRFGQLVRKVQRTMGKTFVQRWQYAANGRLELMTYPDGSVVDYQYDPQGRMVEMGVTIAGRTREKVAYDVLYHPWGGPARWRSMADRMVVRTQNLNGQPGIVQAQNAAEVPIDGINLGYEFDEVGNLKRLRDGNQADPPERIYGYDALNRLTEAKDAANVVWQSYSYDKTGNRQTAGWREVVAQQDCTGVGPGEPCAPLPPTTQWKTDAYTYHPGTHRLFGRSGRERSYDNAGNLILDVPMGVETIDPPPPPPGGGETESAAYAGTMQVMDDAGGGMEQAPPGAVVRGYSYNAANRMSGTSLAGEHLMSYRHNGRGERVYRQGIDKTVHTVFDPAGRWIGDYDAEGAIIQQAIWFGDLPVGLLARDGGTTRLFHVEPDMLGSPRAVIDPARGTNGTVVWRWDLAGEAFGNDKPNEDPDGDGTAFVLDMRFPGQQYDSASGLNYNYFRDYESATARYVESDPIGLQGGVSTYGYVGGDPHGWADVYGLLRWSTNPDVWSKTITEMSSVPNFTGGAPFKILSSTAARTTAEWTIGVKCVCSSSGGSYSVEEFDVVLTPIVYIRRSYNTSRQTLQVRRNENQHIKDILTWYESARSGAQDIEDELRIKPRLTEEECEAFARRRMQNFLQQGASDAFDASYLRYDATGLHDL